MKKKLMSFERYLEVECWSQPELKDLQPVLSSVASACIQISKMVSRAQTDDIYGAAVNKEGETLDDNIQGETQQKLDVICNEIMLRAFCSASSNVAAVASEEEDEARSCSAVMDSEGMEFGGGEYVAVFDPIDGSKNIDSSLPVGTIFGIYKYRDLPPAGVGTFLQPGRNLVASGYCLYSATTVLVLTMGKGVDGFTLDPDRRMFLRTHEDMRVPDSGPLICMNEANYGEFDEGVRHYLKQVKSRGVSDGKVSRKTEISE
ncbi:hypothetical protein TL16_g00799 [Triparma laevis f. inornata]|uniref:fructose-bisphosphatase n=1 Tax=Triparma laevis f. inornata TaxID=1714386 RepID=A0A9W6ZH95_9STRA|nr:hypothetical protein TL16_g00799 [Triparma laevis f. inornata]